MTDNGENVYKLFNDAMKKEFNIKFSVDEAKIIFDALSSHRFKIAQKKFTLSTDHINPKQENEVREFMNQRLQAIENEIERTDEIFKKIGKFMKNEA